ncbi:MAG TPA: family 20 glycosylhydrolase [Candidatus Angelobacter sp.]|nr:family 20 glycosylhydrolase [Candidatus Angelobacter sp.]
MPLPQKIQPGAGRFLINNNFSVALQGPEDMQVKHAAKRFQAALSHITGIPLVAANDGAIASNFIIHWRTKGEKTQKLGEDESYRLEVTATEVHLDAPTPLGVLHGLQTFLQLAQIGPEGFAAPVVAIDDSPRFPWRGLLIDVARHFMPVKVIKRELDGMETVKLNVLHWHLSDDQGFRVESKKFPQLQKLSSDGQFYTQSQIKEIIAYARDRGIRVVPEFDMPGHTTSWFAAYPELASAPGPYEISRHFGVHDAAMDPTRERTYKFLDKFIGEMARLFPDKYFHIGGDEVNGKQWADNPHIQAFMHAHGLKDSRDLQGHFNKRLQTIVKKHGKIMEGWDEILHADLPKEVVVQSWRGQKALADAVQQGYRGMLSFGYYLDLMQPASQHYLIDPFGGAAANLTDEEKQRVLGGEACMWSELITTVNIDERIWPRAAAVAERLWSAQEVRDVDDMYRRLAKLSERLEWAKLEHVQSYDLMLERLLGGSDIQPLRVLADVLEPVKGYARPHTKHYETTTPLNRLVDAVKPESDAARIFSGRVQRFLNKSATPDDLSEMQKSLTLWRDNDQQLAPVLQGNPLLQEAVPMSQALASVASAGLKALEYLNAGTRVPAAWRQQQIDLLKQAQAPQAEMLNMIAPGVQKLVEATTPE